MIWRYGTTVDARAAYSGAKHEISGARAWLALAMQKNAQLAIVLLVMINFIILRALDTFKSTTVFMIIWLLQ